LTYLDLDEVAQMIGQRPFAGLLRLAPDVQAGFERDLDALPNTLTPERHYGYALQWFGFAAALALIYLILLFRTSRT
jgi:cytochrome oxidase assembly protein ShyY1